MPKKQDLLTLREQPINWGRSVVCGIVSTIFMMGFIDTFYMMGLTPFSFELYLGSLIRGTQHGVHNWTIGFFANCVTGAIFGALYGYFFEYGYKRANTQVGVWVGGWHAVIAAIAFFPFFGAIHDFIGSHLYPNFGFFGSGLGAETPVLLLTGHLLFGACMGLFYGPVRAERVRARQFEPGEVGVPVSEGGIGPAEDAEDRVAV